MITTTLILTLYLSSSVAVMVDQEPIAMVATSPLMITEQMNSDAREPIAEEGLTVEFVVTTSKPTGANSTRTEYPTGFT